MWVTLVVKSDFISADSSQAEADETISSFKTLVEEYSNDGIIDFKIVAERPFQGFWKHMIIYKYLPEEDDFVVVMFGTRVADFHGQDWTGKKISELGIDEESTKQMIKLNRDALLNREHLFVSGAINLDKNEYRN